MKKTIFISYDYDEDRHYRNLLSAWDKNDEFDFKYYDASLNVAVNSEDANYVKRIIRPKILAASHLLCIVGKETYQSEWVEWEIDTAIEAGKKLIAVKIEKGNTTPSALLNAGAKWAMSFTFDSIKSAVESA